jgi:hypothetical protein
MSPKNNYPQWEKRPAKPADPGKTLCEIFAEEKITKAKGARDESLAQVEDNAEDEWIAEATSAFEQFLKHNETMFVDDLWAWSGLERPRESRALGPVFVAAARAGWMKKTGAYRNSVASKMGPKPVWRSLIYDEAAGAYERKFTPDTPRDNQLDLFGGER